jgi:hypothetical protein
MKHHSGSDLCICSTTTNTLDQRSVLADDAEEQVLTR